MAEKLTQYEIRKKHIFLLDGIKRYKKDISFLYKAVRTLQKMCDHPDIDPSAEGEEARCPDCGYLPEEKFVKN